MKRLLFFITILVLSGCKAHSDRLSEDDILRTSFSESELNDLQQLYDFFNQTICDSNENLDDCYKSYFQKVKQSADSGSIYLHIPFEQQQSVYENFNDSTFYQVWAFGKKWNPDTQQDTLREVYFRWDGKFMDFLKKAGTEDEFIKSYHESVEAAGGPPPSLIAGIIMNYDKLNIKDIKIKFVIAIHYLTLNDQYKRIEKKLETVANIGYG